MAAHQGVGRTKTLLTGAEDLSISLPVMSLRRRRVPTANSVAKSEDGMEEAVSHAPRRPAGASGHVQTEEGTTATDGEDTRNGASAAHASGLGMRRAGVRLPGLAVTVSAAKEEAEAAPISARTRLKMREGEREGNKKMEPPESSGLASTLQRALRLRTTPQKKKTPGRSPKKRLYGAASGSRTLKGGKGTVVSGRAAREAYFGEGEERSEFSIRSSGRYQDSRTLGLPYNDSYAPDSGRQRGQRLGFDGDIVKAHSLLAHLLDSEASPSSNASLRREQSWQENAVEWARCERELTDMMEEACSELESLHSDMKLWPKWYLDIPDVQQRARLSHALANVLSVAEAAIDPLAPLKGEEPPLSPLDLKGIMSALEAEKQSVLSFALQTRITKGQAVIAEVRRLGEGTLVMVRRADYQAIQELSTLIHSIRVELRHCCSARHAAGKRWVKSRAVLPALHLRAKRRPLLARDSLLVRTLRHSLSVSGDDDAALRPPLPSKTPSLSPSRPRFSATAGARQRGHGGGQARFSRRVSNDASSPVREAASDKLNGRAHGRLGTVQEGHVSVPPSRRDDVAMADSEVASVMTGTARLAGRQLASLSASKSHVATERSGQEPARALSSGTGWCVRWSMQSGVSQGKQARGGTIGVLR
eukprot:CAMPEP_0181301290 /NCGR_PEP_ID=MMETSP1101-20121128/7342_1 /TAXON_ID=46948 /ORGANISM="Rhodomonas abbreviata, Strain Caron Lab Isolate" /LENGTH=646 /DNA_ID=CAMNT_0023406579 /DNA_START=351 /DNA_END=2288 /DNA_ORIENTATION=+